MKRIILIGRTGSGKTTFTQEIIESEKEYKKTQSIEWHDSVIDTPGEYIENRRFYNALITTSFDCEIVGLVQDSIDEGCIFPPGFAAIFNKTVIGIITKIDNRDKNIDYAKECLLNAGAQEIFEVSAFDGRGMKDIKMFLDL
ncbi:EutP/PduV family microcompartment system protein [Wukongibacter baidiensis]|uniref:EutP/PduV family microcompartment system protein n=1 Tax=Wukongibacter baidiensis TaxID=1723361 RepID=UPI003D7F85ED